MPSRLLYFSEFRYSTQFKLNLRENQSKLKTRTLKLVKLVKLVIAEMENRFRSKVKEPREQQSHVRR